MFIGQKKPKKRRNLNQFRLICSLLTCKHVEKLIVIDSFFPHFDKTSTEKPTHTRHIKGTHTHMAHKCDDVIFIHKMIKKNYFITENW